MAAHRIALIGLGAIILTATAALAQNTSNPLCQSGAERK